MQKHEHKNELVRKLKQ